MLILTRRIGETIIIGDEIYITALKARCSTQSVFGISAPAHISIHREEIYNKILKEKNFTSKEHFARLKKGLEDTFNFNDDDNYGALVNGKS